MPGDPQREDSVAFRRLQPWSMVGPKTFATKIMGIFTSMDKLVGRDFEKGLAQLKARSES